MSAAHCWHLLGLARPGPGRGSSRHKRAHRARPGRAARAVGFLLRPGEAPRPAGPQQPLLDAHRYFYIFLRPAAGAPGSTVRSACLGTWGAWPRRRLSLVAESLGRVVAAAERLWMFERGGWCCNVALRRRPSDFLGRSAATRRSESLRGRRRERPSSPRGTDRTGPALPEPPRPTRQLRVQQRLASESHHGGRARRCPAGRSEIRSGAHCGKDTSVEDAFRKQIPTRHSKRQQKVILLPGTEARICRNFDCRRVSQRLLNCLDKEWGARGSVRETCSPIKLH